MRVNNSWIVTLYGTSPHKKNNLDGLLLQASVVRRNATYTGEITHMLPSLSLESSTAMSIFIPR